MIGDWLVGERDKLGIVRLYVRCGGCAAKLWVSDGNDARELLRWHKEQGHSLAVATSESLFAGAGAA